MSAAVTFEDGSRGLSGKARCHAATWRRAAILLAALTPLVVGSLHTLHTLESLLLVALAVLPAASVIVGFLMRDAYGVERTQAAASALLTVVLGSALFVLLANQWLDRSSALRRTYTIESKDSDGSLGAAGFRIRFVPNVDSPLRDSWLVQGGEAISLDAVAWARVVPGQTTLTISLHPGLFGFSWYESQLSLGALAPAD